MTLSMPHEFELACLAHQHRVLQCNLDYPKTIYWQRENRWYPDSSFLYPITNLIRDLFNPKQNFILKTMSSRYNFVYAAKHSGADFRCNQDNKPFLDIALSRQLLPEQMNSKYDVIAFDHAFYEFMKTSKSSYLKPELEQFLR